MGLEENEPLSQEQSAADNATNKGGYWKAASVWIAGISRRTFTLTVVSGVASGLIVWFVQSYLSKMEHEDSEAALVGVIMKSVSSECDRLQGVFVNFYDGYPTLTCEINVYRLPQPDVALVDYLNNRRETVVRAMGDDGVMLIRTGALSSEAYKRIFNNQYFRSTIHRETVTFHDYFAPLQQMCAAAGVSLEIQACPYY